MYIRLSASIIAIFLITVTADATELTGKSGFYNLTCLSNKIDVLVNTYSYELAIRSVSDPVKTVTLETILVEESAACEGCYDITSLLTSDSSKYVIVAKLRKKGAKNRHRISLAQNSKYTIELYRKNKDGKFENLVPVTPCYENMGTVIEAKLKSE
ncbi:MAG: hypothetical protein A2Z20_08440 [Bdellovibrionales bacterium RBG_16_40_8]|nr:MAG: hypothetical protein A2Z20_08440 [Bdellovibrionales bacterium RBG_16_40_8]